MGPGFVVAPRPPPKRTRAQMDEERTRIAKERCAKVVALRDEGWKLKDIGKEMGVSVERVRQLEMKGRRMAWFQTPEGAAERERQQAKEQAEKQAQEAIQAARRDAIKRARDRPKRRHGESRAAYEARLVRTTPVAYDPDIVLAHAEQQLWRQFVEPREPPVAHPPAWLRWNGSAAGVTYRDLPGRFEAVWQAHALVAQ